jgi:hypothetical protein
VDCGQIISSFFISRLFAQSLKYLRWAKAIDPLKSIFKKLFVLFAGKSFHHITRSGVIGKKDAVITRHSGIHPIQLLISKDARTGCARLDVVFCAEQNCPRMAQCPLPFDITSDLAGVFWQPSRMASSYIKLRTGLARRAD